MSREIIPGRARTEHLVAPPNPIGFAYSRIPASQDNPGPRTAPEAPYRGEWCHVNRWWKPVQCNSTPSRYLPKGEVAKPISDGSGVHWRVVDRDTGATLWRIEAGDFDRALAEKRRLCRLTGGKSGYAYLRQD